MNLASGKRYIKIAKKKEDKRADERLEKSGSDREMKLEWNDDACMI